MIETLLKEIWMLTLGENLKVVSSQNIKNRNFLTHGTEYNVLN